MATITEPISFEQEEIMDIPVASSGSLCRAISGYANFYNKEFANENGAPLDVLITGDIYPSDDDKKWRTYTVHMVVGPKWHDVRDVSPIVAVAGFSFMDSDSADSSGTEILECKWDTVGLSEGQTELEKIRLKVKLRLCGGNGYSIIKLAYHLIAVGK